MIRRKNTVIIISAPSENDAINFSMTSVSDCLQNFNYHIEYFDLTHFDREGLDRFFATISSDKVAFGLTWCGIGQDIETIATGASKQNAWEYFNVPLLKFHGDSLAYFIERHMDTPSNAVNVYGCQEQIDFHKLIFPDSRCISAIADPCIYYDTDEKTIDFSKKAKGKLFFLKNSRDPSSLQFYWRNQLSPEIGKQLRDISCEVITAGLRPGKISIHDIVIDYLEERKIDIRCNISLLCFYVAQMDDYLRRVKSTMIAQALLPFPVVILGQGWDYLDTTKAVATIAPSQDPKTTESIYLDQLGIVDMSPNIDTGCHDRMCRAAGTYSFVLANQTTWLNNLLPAMNEAGYTFHPDQIQTAVSNALKDPDRCIELGRQYGRAFRDQYESGEFVGKLSILAEMTGIRDARPTGCNPD